MHQPILTDVVILLGVSILVVYLSHRAHLPAVVGFLITGVLLGPHGLGVVHGVEEVELLAEIGVILVLFSVGLEFSLAELLRMRRAVLVGGSVQVLGVLVATFGLLYVVGITGSQAFFLGLIASLSSTAVVMRLLQSRGELDAPHGRLGLAVLVYQDLMIVPMMLLIPVLAGTGGGVGGALAGFALKAAAVLAAVLVLARGVVPRLLSAIVRTRSRDLFLLSIVAMCLATAWGAAEAGLSLALGAFLAGLIVSESEYSVQALSDILPFRDLFASFFFISIGMLLDVDLVMSEPLGVVALVGCVLFVKGLVAGTAALVLRTAFSTAVLAGVALSQVGEFSFVLARNGLAEGLLSSEAYRWFVVVAVGSIGVTPLLMAGGPRLARALSALPLPQRIRAGGLSRLPPPGGVDAPPESDHVVVIGFGLNGRNVARAARVAGVPVVAIDMNPTIVAAARLEGVPILFGDATQRPMLEHLGAGTARVAVVAISDPAATRMITAQLRDLAPGCRIIARTRHLSEVEPLREAGADVVIPEELETSVEIVARLLAGYLVPRREIEAFLAELRAGGYEMLRTPVGGSPSLADLGGPLTDVEITTLRVDVGSPMVGRPLAETDLRRLYGVSVLAIRRGDRTIPNPGGDAAIEEGDALVVLGLAEEINAASVLFAGGAHPDVEST